jgi:hypothetical protein
MLANVVFRNEFGQLDPGIEAQTLATGTTSGSALQLGGLAPFGKMLFRVLAASGSAAASLSAYLMTATASNGTFASLSATLTSIVISAASAYRLVLDTRNEAFANLATNALWVKVVLVLTGAPVPLAVDVLGWESGTDPASAYDGATVVTSETDFY